jgi:Haem-binding domain
VRTILRHSFYNCHSNETKLLWFDRISPAYWFVTQDVRRARQHVNFSEIGVLSPRTQKAALFDTVNQIQLGAMPLPSFLLSGDEESLELLIAPGDRIAHEGDNQKQTDS